MQKQQIELDSLLEAILAKSSERDTPIYRAGHGAEPFQFQVFESPAEAEPCLC